MKLHIAGMLPVVLVVALITLSGCDTLFGEEEDKPPVDLVGTWENTSLWYPVSCEPNGGYPAKVDGIATVRFYSDGKARWKEVWPECDPSVVTEVYGDYEQGVDTITFSPYYTETYEFGYSYSDGILKISGTDVIDFPGGISLRR